MSAESNICEGCPAAFALGLHTDELAKQDGTFQLEMRRNDAERARFVLEEAAGQIACQSMDKSLPDLPESVPPTGSDELVSFVSQCPSFAKYLAMRRAEL